MTAGPTKIGWAAAIAVVAVYLPVVRWLAGIWDRDPYSVQGFFVLPFSAFLLWNDREHIRGNAGAPDPRGLGLLAAGLALLGLALHLRSAVLAGLSVPLSASGLVWWSLGHSGFRAAWFPLVFLAFMTPVPAGLVQGVSLDLQLFAAWFTAGVLGMLGIPVFHQGVILELRNTTLRVAEICNGVRFLMALLVLATAFAHVSQRTRRAKLILVAAAVPAAILANALRVTVLAIVAHTWGGEAASGTAHHMIGKAIWASAIVPLLLLGLWLRRQKPAPETLEPAVAR
jgi:exosortase